MIELRWIHREVFPSDEISFHPRMIRVLQYRQKIHVSIVGDISDWSEWKDVPEVEE